MQSLYDINTINNDKERMNGLTNYKDSIDVAKIKTKQGASSC